MLFLHLVENLRALQSRRIAKGDIILLDSKFSKPPPHFQPLDDCQAGKFFDDLRGAHDSSLFSE